MKFKVNLPWAVNGENLVLWGKTPHTQVLPFYPNYEYDNPTPGTVCDYRDPRNVTGHTQRAFVIYWALRGFAESGFYPGIDIGGGGVLTPGCISVDTVGSGEMPAYGGSYDGVHIKADGSKLENFGANSFSSVVSNHLLEHVVCDYYSPIQGDQKARKAYGCSGHEIIHTLHRWLEVLRSGGYIAAITPDEKFMEGVGSSFLFIDETHQHAFDSRTFKELVLDKVDGAKLIQFDTLHNNFSFDFVLKKK